MGYWRLQRLCWGVVLICLVWGQRCVGSAEDSKNGESEENEDKGPQRGDQAARGDSRSREKTCKSGWEDLHRKCYKFVAQPTSSWDHAKQDCEREGAQLLSVTSTREVEEVTKELQKKTDQRSWWVGLRKNASSDWQWLDSRPLVYRLTPWRTGEPNNEGQEENCAEMNSKAALNDKECNALRPFICEKDPRVSTPVTTASATTTTTTTTNSPRTTASVDGPSVTKTSRKNDVTSVGGRTVATSSRRQASTLSSKVSSPSADDNHTFPEVESERGGSARETKGEKGDRQNRTGGDGEEGVKDRYKGCSTGESRKGRRRFRYTVGSNVCPPGFARNRWWPETPGGVTESRPCKRGNGNITFTCGGIPTCWRGEPNLDQCASRAFRGLLKRLSAEDGDGQEPDPEETLALTSELASVTKGDDVTEDDIVASSKLIKAVRRGARKIKDRRKVKSIIANVVKAGSNLVSLNKSSVWTRMDRQNKIHSATSLLVAMETTTVAMAEELEEPTSIVTTDDNIELELRVVNLSSAVGQQHQGVEYRALDSDTHFSIPLLTLTNLSSGGLARMVFMTHYTMGDILDGGASDDDDSDNLVDADDNGDNDDDDDDKAEGGKEDDEDKPAAKLASYVITATVASSSGEAVTKLPRPVTFTVIHTKKIPENFESVCAFWSISESGLGSWSQDGCRKVASNASHTQCQCDHMTNFAVLMSVREVQISDEHKSSLRVVTIVGCIVSCLCLLASWITFTCFSSLQGERNSIHKNLVACLFVAEMLFLVGIDQTANRVACGVVAGFLHYFFMATFLWMMMEAVHIILMLVQVFDASRSRLPYYYLCAYVPPLLIIAISAGVYADGYGTEHYCWLTTEREFIWSFAGPVAVILFVNSAVLIYAMTMVCRHSDYVFSAKDKTSADSVRSWIQGALALEVLLGLTWVIGFFFLSEQSVAAAYIFTILNSTQGLFIFLFHCLLNKKTRKEYQRVMKLKRQPSSTGSGTQSASLARNKLTHGPSFKHNNPPPSQDTSRTNV